MLLPETQAILLVRHAVRSWLQRHQHTEGVAVGLSGGADSLALTAAAVAEASQVHALVVDHRLQPGSDVVAREAAARATELGCASVRVLAVDVDGTKNLEAAAREARYDALHAARGDLPVLLGHTLDDQAETVLMGLGRGSGARSIWGMRSFDPPWGRPLLEVRRDVTRAVCGDLGIVPHDDPHNFSPDFTRVRVRSEVLPLLEDVLGGGVAKALARTGEHLREDGEVLDTLADALHRKAAVGRELDIDAVATEPPAVRRRAIRLWLLEQGAKVLTNKQIQAVDGLVTNWRGQGGVAVAGGSPDARLVASRRHGRLTLDVETQPGRVED